MKALPPVELTEAQRSDVTKILSEIGKTGGHIVKGAPTGRALLDLSERDGHLPGGLAGLAGGRGRQQGSMMAKAEAPQGDENNPCLVPAGGGFRRSKTSSTTWRFTRAATRRVRPQVEPENGSVAVRWVGQSGLNGEILEIEGLNPDTVLGFSAGQWWN